MDRSRSENISFATESKDGDPSLMKIAISHVSFWQLPAEDGFTYSTKYQAQVDGKGATSQVLVNYWLNRVAGWQNTLKVYDIHSDEENDEPGWHTSFIKDITAKAKKLAKSKSKSSAKGNAKANACGLGYDHRGFGYSAVCTSSQYQEGHTVFNSAGLDGEDNISGDDEK